MKELYKLAAFLLVVMALGCGYIWGRADTREDVIFWRGQADFWEALTKEQKSAVGKCTVQLKADIDALKVCGFALDESREVMRRSGVEVARATILVQQARQTCSNRDVGYLGKVH